MNNTQEELLTEASLAVRKVQVATPEAYNEADAALTAISNLRSRLKAIYSSKELAKK
jgi:hypothetical protein